MICLFCGKRKEIFLPGDEFENQGATHFIYECRTCAKYDDSVEGTLMICKCDHFQTIMKADLFNHMVTEHTHLEIACKLCGHIYHVHEFMDDGLQKHCLEHHATEQK